MISAYPKVYNLGHPALTDLLVGEVVVQEKVDGSQFTAGLVDGELVCRSKGTQLNLESPGGLFKPAVDTFRRLWSEGLLNGLVYRGEALAKPKHNTLAYDRAPTGGVILFDIDRGPEQRLNLTEFYEETHRLGLEHVPFVYRGPGEELDLATLDSWLELESCLGGARVEGVVIKNYHRWGRDGKMLMGKHVSEAFKEKHRTEWRASNPTRTDILTDLIATYAHPRRWEKAVERLRDAGELEHSPRDIGKLITAVPTDVREECEHEIKDILFSYFWPAIKRGTSRGLAEWYKARLAESQFDK
jgi:hypothetical protein